MASQRQIAANRKNALRSTGPRTTTGKQRASGNAYRHGLSIPSDEEETSESLESLVRRIASNSTDQDLLRFARIAARAHMDLIRIRQIKRDMIGRIVQFEALDPAGLRRQLAAEARYLSWLFRKPLKKLKPVDWLPPEPSEAERDANATQQLLPKIRKLNRYEARAYATMDRALRRARCHQLQNEANLH